MTHLQVHVQAAERAAFARVWGSDANRGVLESGRKPSPKLAPTKAAADTDLLNR